MTNLPGTTYRLQFNKDFNFESARKLLPYLQALGITHIYASPIFKSSKGSMHGYDVVDPTQLNPELGTPDDFDTLIKEAHEKGIFWLQDIVPNHMAFDFENRMLVDLLENGPDSMFFNFFDVEWSYVHFGDKPRMLAPFLGKYYQKALEDKEISLGYDSDGFSINYYDNKFPVRLSSYADILSLRFEKLQNRVGRNYPAVIRLLGLLHIVKFLNTINNIEERYNQITFIKDLLWELYSADDQVKMYINETLKIYNGRKENPESFDLLDKLLSEQYFRLAFWKVANEEINYRRFFNISSLISLKVENEEVFNRTHSLIFKLLKEDKIDGLRVDHIDGLYDPEEYLHRVRDRIDGKYLIVEKILEQDEQLPETWPVEGTTGYDFLNFVNGVFCNVKNENKINRIYTQFTRRASTFDDMVVDKKRLIINTRMAGELERLSLIVEEIAKRDRYGADITLNGIQTALEEVLVHFPIYRTYVNGKKISDSEINYINYTIGELRYNNPRLEYEIGYIGKLLTMQHSSLSEELYEKSINFIMKFQQLTGPLMAKGYEDTALYVYNRFISLNEVGGNPSEFGLPLNEFHKKIRRRGIKWRYSLNATSTHDTKRGEDVRARMNVLSEIPDEWNTRIRKWYDVNLKYKKEENGRFLPDKNDEYFLYQTLIGALPFDEKPDEEFKKRIKEYAIKVVREAKVYTAWVKPDEVYENAFLNFIDNILKESDSNLFLEELLDFHKFTSFYGIFNSLSQTIIKMTAPGVPDFYQGTELWDFNLVDPDNRRPVDYSFREEILRKINEKESEGREGLFNYLYSDLHSGALKLFAIKKLLKARKEIREPFEAGKYSKLKSSGIYKNSIISFARIFEDEALIVAVPRFLTGIVKTGELPIGKEIWKNTAIKIPFAVNNVINIISGESIAANSDLQIGDLMDKFPAAILSCEVKG